MEVVAPEGRGVEELVRIDRLRSNRAEVAGSAVGDVCSTGPMSIDAAEYWTDLASVNNQLQCGTTMRFSRRRLRKDYLQL